MVNINKTPGVTRLSETVAVGAAVREASPGRFLVKIIDAGEGSSGYYPPETLQLAEQERVFKAGTQCFLDHGGMFARGPGGERSVKDLAAVLTSDAVYDQETDALVAEALVFSDRADRLREIAPHIGMSISASAVMGPPMPGQTKATVRRIVAAESVDFVVAAGRGGAILQVLESATPKVSEAAANDRRDQLELAVDATYDDPTVEMWTTVRDFDEDKRLVWFYIGTPSGPGDVSGLYQEGWTPASNDQSVTLDGNRIAVRAVTQYVPVNSDGTPTTTQEGKKMPEISEARLAELTEASGQVGVLTSERDAAIRRAEEAEAKVAQAERAGKVAEAKRAAADKITAALQGEPAPLVAKISTALVATIEAEVPADFDTKINEALAAEKAYIASLTEGKLTGFGPSQPIGESATTPKRTTNAFGQPIKE